MGSESAYGARCTPSSVTIAVISDAGVTSKAGLRGGEPGRDLGGVSLLDRDRGAVRRRAGSIVEVGATITNGISWWWASTASAVRADLVGGVAVRGDPVGARDHDVDLAGGHARARRRVDDDGMRDPERIELERGQAGALEQRTCLVDPHVATPPRSAAERIAPTAEP